MQILYWEKRRSLFHYSCIIEPFLYFGPKYIQIHRNGMCFGKKNSGHNVYFSPQETRFFVQIYNCAYAKKTHQGIIRKSFVHLNVDMYIHIFFKQLKLPFLYMGFFEGGKMGLHTAGTEIQNSSKFLQSKSSMILNIFEILFIQTMHHVDR